MQNTNLTPLTRSTATAAIAFIWGHYAFQGHSRSLILIPIESQYATSYQLIIRTYIVSPIVFQLSRSIGQIIDFDRGFLYLMHSFSVIYANIIINHLLPKSRFLGLHLCFRQYGASFNQLDVVGFKS